MAKTSRYIIWAHRDERSLFGAAANPVVRNGALLYFEDKRYAMSECDRLNARSGILTSVTRSSTRSGDGGQRRSRRASCRHNTS